MWTPIEHDSFTTEQKFLYSELSYQMNALVKSTVHKMESTAVNSASTCALLNNASEEIHSKFARGPLIEWFLSLWIALRAKHILANSTFCFCCVTSS